MRSVPAAPAEVVADAFHGQTLQRVVQRLDPDPAMRVVGLQIEVRLMVPKGRDPGVVDLELEPRIDDRAVLLAERVGERPEELLLCRVVLVPHVDLGARRRDHRHEGVRDLDAVERRLQIRDVTPDGGRVVGDRTDADRPRRDGRPERPVAAVEEDVRRLLRVRIEVREPQVVAAAQRRKPAEILALDASQPLGDVPLPDRLAVLTVVDHVDAGLDLSANDVGDGCGELLRRRFAE